MAIKTDRRHETITTSAGGGCLSLFGLVFASFGGFFVYLLLSGGDVTVNGRPGQPSDIWLPGIFVAIGAVIGLSRFRMVLDLRSRTLSKSFSCIVPLHSKVTPIGEPEEVTLCREVRRGQKNSTVVYPVRLVAGGESLDLTCSQSCDQARRDGEAVAALAGVPLHDSSSGESHVRQHDELDQSVMDSTVEEEVVERPSDSALGVEDRIRELIIRLPPARDQLLFRGVGLFLLAPMPLAFWWFAWRPGLGDLAARGLGGWLFAHSPLLMVGFVVLLAVLGTLRMGLFGQTLTVERSGIRVKSLLRSTRIGVRELEELRVVTRRGHGGVLARSDDVSVLCGQGLSDPDKHYLRWLILEHLRGGRRGR